MTANKRGHPNGGYSLKTALEHTRIEGLLWVGSSPLATATRGQGPTYSRTQRWQWRTSLFPSDRHVGVHFGRL